MSHADEFFAVQSGKVKTARKPHRCDACREAIAAGERYYDHKGLIDGTWERTKQCMRCHAIWRELVRACPGEPILMRLDCGEEWEDVLGPCPADVAALAFALPGEVAL
jgi:hypothetical protein